MVTSGLILQITHLWPLCIYLHIRLFLKNEFEPVSLQTQIPLTSKQKYNSKFQEFETVRTLKIQKTRTNLDEKSFLKINNCEKTNKKGGKKKESNLPKSLPSFSFFCPLLSLFPTTI